METSLTWIVFTVENTKDILKVSKNIAIPVLSCLMQLFIITTAITEDDENIPPP